MYIVDLKHNNIGRDIFFFFGSEPKQWHVMVGVQHNV